MAKRLGMVAAVVAVLSAGVIGVGEAQAGLLGCSYPALSQPFSQWGDSSQYYLDPGGSFEGWNTWRLSAGAYVGGGNEPWYVSGFGSHSLVLPGGASATGPASCITGTDLKVRLFAKSSDGSSLRVDVMVPSALGLLRVATTFSVDTATTWQPTSSVVNLANVLSVTDLSSTNLYLRVSSPSGATFQVDDVYVDPGCWI